MKIIVVVLMFQEVIQDVQAFIGDDARAKAHKQFEKWTKVDYMDFAIRKEAGESSEDILGEDFAGTELYGITANEVQ
ncbi:hypothetical protein PV433_10705 [Paenibacillus sp. GYB004]|uniref:hypothetical protein n=1 Tax=Paenibacillus sp. GYB004 TaxID=2994393 RepID=UPI002F966D36